MTTVNIRKTERKIVGKLAFLECLLTRFRGSLENCTPPELFRFTRYELFAPINKFLV